MRQALTKRRLNRKPKAQSKPTSPQQIVIRLILQAGEMWVETRFALAEVGRNLSIVTGKLFGNVLVLGEILFSLRHHPGVGQKPSCSAECF